MRNLGSRKGGKEAYNVKLCKVEAIIRLCIGNLHVLIFKNPRILLLLWKESLPTMYLRSTMNLCVVCILGAI